MKNLIPHSALSLSLTLSVLLLAGCATRPPRSMGPPPAPVMPPVKQGNMQPVPENFAVEFKAPVIVEHPLAVSMPAPAPQPRKGTSYTVRKGESLSAIAVRNHMSWTSLAEYNYITNPNNVRAGQVILIPDNGNSAPTTQHSTKAAPPPAQVSSNGSTYVVQSGDSLSVIARHYGTSVGKLKEVNGLKSDRLLVGQILKLPTGASASTSTTETSHAPAPRPTPVLSRPTPVPVSEVDPLEMHSSTETPVEQPSSDLDPVINKAFPIVVQEGDTLQSIANNYIVPMEEIRKLNNLPANAEVKPGQKLQIPPSVY